MSPERLAALQRQRELVAQHLAWLDRELAAATPENTSAPDAPPAPVTSSARPTATATPTPPPPTPAPIPAPSTPPVASADPASDTERLAAANARANAILEEYSATDRFNPETTRRGCMLFAVAVLLLGFAGLLLIYILRYR